MKINRKNVLGGTIVRNNEESTANDNLITVLWSTGYKGLRTSWDGKKYYEELSLNESAVDLETRLNKGAPFLLQHDSDNLSSIIGSVQRAWLADGNAYAEIKLSKRASVQGYIDDIKDGILRNISVGYKIEQLEDVTAKGDKIPTYRATKWTPLELSVVTIPFDPNAQILRNEESSENIIEMAYNEDVSSVEESEEAAQTLEEATPVAEETREEEQAQDKSEETREEEEQISETISDNELARCEQIRAICSVIPGQTSENLVEEFIKQSLTPEQVSERVFELLQNPNKKEVKPMNKQEQLQSYLLARILGKRVEDTNIYNGRKFIDAISDVFERQAGESDTQFIKRATVTSDLPELLANVANKALVNDEKEKTYAFEKLTFQMQTKDFRPTMVPTLGALALAAKTEGGAYASAVLADSGEYVELNERGTIVSISQKALLSDDLGMLRLLPQKMKNAGKRDIQKRFIAHLNANPTMASTKELFCADHGNIEEHTTLDLAALEKINAKMRAFNDDSGENLGLGVKYLLVGPGNELKAKQLGGPIMPGNSQSYNPWAGQIEVFVDNSIANDEVFAFCDEEQYSPIVSATLEGSGVEPQVDIETNFSTGNYEVRVSCPNAVKAISYKGIVRLSIVEEEEE